MSSASAIRAGQAFVELTAKDSGLKSGLATAQRQMQQFADNVGAIGKSLAVAGASILAPMFGAVRMFASTGDGLLTISQRTGVAVESLSLMRQGLELGGSSLSGFEGSLRAMQVKLAQAVKGSESAAKAFRDVGLSIEKLAQFKPEQQFLAVAEAISRITDETLQTAAAQELWGKSGTQMLPFIQNGIAGVKQQMEEARAAGQLTTEAQAKSAADLQKAMTDASAAMKEAAKSIGDALAPAAISAAEKLKEMGMQAAAFIGNNKELVNTIAAIALVAAGAGGALTGLKTVYQGIVFMGGKLKSAFNLATKAAEGFFGFIAARAGGSAGMAKGMFGDILDVLKETISKDILPGVKLFGQVTAEEANKASTALVGVRLGWLGVAAAVAFAAGALADWMTRDDAARRQQEMDDANRRWTGMTLAEEEEFDQEHTGNPAVQGRVRRAQTAREYSDALAGPTLRDDEEERAREYRAQKFDEEVEARRAAMDKAIADQEAAAEREAELNARMMEEWRAQIDEAAAAMQQEKAERDRMIEGLRQAAVDAKRMQDAELVGTSEAANTMLRSMFPSHMLPGKEEVERQMLAEQKKVPPLLKKIEQNLSNAEALTVLETA